MITPALLAVVSGSLAIASYETSLVGCSANALLAALSLIDTNGRFREYRRTILELRTTHDVKGTIKKLVKIYKTSHCQRQALLLAAWYVHIDHYRDISKQLHSSGYRWWQVVPEWMTKQPLYFFTKRFWKVLLR